MAIIARQVRGHGGAAVLERGADAMRERAHAEDQDGRGFLRGCSEHFCHGLKCCGRLRLHPRENKMGEGQGERVQIEDPEQFDQKWVIELD